MNRDELEGIEVAVRVTSGSGPPYSLRKVPSFAASVIGRLEQVWLEDAVFFVPGPRVKTLGAPHVSRFVVGFIIRPRPTRVTTKHGWTVVRLDPESGGCFQDARTGRCLRGAKYVRLYEGKIAAFGVQPGEAVGDAREWRGTRITPPGLAGLPTLGPDRKSWVGEMGGTNFEPATREETLAAIRWALCERFPGAVIVDGSDDWDAPPTVRPELWAREFGLRPLAWWHTGTSGQTKSGLVLRRSQYDELRSLYRAEFGCDLEAIPGCGTPPLTRSSCGCWQGEGVAVYRL